MVRSEQEWRALVDQYLTPESLKAFLDQKSKNDTRGGPSQSGGLADGPSDWNMTRTGLGSFDVRLIGQTPDQYIDAHFELDGLRWKMVGMSVPRELLGRL